MIKWIWRIYRINGSFKPSLEEINGNWFSYDHLKEFHLCPFIYAKFDGHWSISSPEDDDGDRLKKFIEEGYEFKGSVGLKTIRKRKIELIYKNKIMKKSTTELFVSYKYGDNDIGEVFTTLKEAENEANERNSQMKKYQRIARFRDNEINKYEAITLYNAIENIKDSVREDAEFRTRYPEE